jgi:hypothetical protein
MLIMMLEKHGIIAARSSSIPRRGWGRPEPPAKFVPEAEYERAYRLFYSEREGEL